MSKERRQSKLKAYIQCKKKGGKVNFNIKHKPTISTTRKNKVKSKEIVRRQSK